MGPGFRVKILGALARELRSGENPGPIIHLGDCGHGIMGPGFRVKILGALARELRSGGESRSHNSFGGLRTWNYGTWISSQNFRSARTRAPFRGRIQVP